ncbi:hypothetical protein CTEN210_16960 [Chaetoceros tenuissimus]|uniref:TraB domain-containing protein n=1 Tax=Chaetoceros tenuissimus TaxID=426638 RepID=A0AAD3HES1_9STRA|nr:hypothetical protein CTEN210_16960 [Chaetoceros tenuissimus]
MRGAICLNILSLFGLLKGVPSAFGWKINDAFLLNAQITKNSFAPLKIPRGGSSTISSSHSSLTDIHEVWRDELPEQLQNRRGALMKFVLPTGATDTNGVAQMCDVYVLGTAHVSKDSCEDVKFLMKHIKPDVLFIEICTQRLNILEDVPDIQSEDESGKAKSVGEMTKEVMLHNPEMNKAAALSSVLLTKIQGDYASKLNVTIGGEFREAFKVAVQQHGEFMKLVETVRREQANGFITEETLQKARNSNGCTVVLGDRPVRLTLLRAWESLGVFGKIKLVGALLWSSIRQPDVDELREWIESIMNDPTNDILSKSIEDLSRHFPAIKKTIIEERDVFMAMKIIQTVRIMGVGSSQDGNRRKIVVVIGAGHGPGVSRILKGEVERFKSIDVEEELKKVIETKKNKVDSDDEMKSLITEVVSMEPVPMNN